jgi:hypothetical protein
VRHVGRSRPIPEQHNDMLVCSHQDPRAFEKLRRLLLMRCSASDKALVALGEQ